MHQNFCLKIRIKKRFQNTKILTLELDRCLIKTQGKTKFEKNITERTETVRQEKSDAEQTRDFINIFQTKLRKKKKKNIDMKLFNKYFTYKTPDEMLQTLYNSKSINENINILKSAMDNFEYFAERNMKRCQKMLIKNKLKY